MVWDTLVEQSESFTTIGDPKHKDAPIKPKLTLKEAVKEVATEQKTKTRTEKTDLKMPSHTVHQSHTTHQPKSEVNTILNW